ncbi:MAG: hypothetical protein UX15_C0004G0007 [Parcubacteria group bacterium GW2011_GWA1_45_7]|nr:MAG: hypothetical protein US61_C0041G0002 [Parcubacteria group bacterium GW2011_GWE2_37_8]KKU11484.1 MAG: hypothetical protein UX15_C0004G0007 [Parcubacteria group bacterium GW2011_GWA1_45_7]OGI41317.1 MAG: hypothetical protein A2593_02470 [Candidatus Moranbacteria bacterium RIFOXYD1_FULL_44_9]HBT81028.1 hypothetical protein [Candidatus Yanofskybacteria bacterium]
MENKDTILEILKEMPIIEVACKKAGIGRATYYRWRKEDKEFRRQSDDALSHGIEFINDMSESQLITLIKEKKMPAITLWLRNNHPRYGSRTKIYTPASSREDLSSEEERIVLDALALVSGIKADEQNNSTISQPDSGESQDKESVSI